mmetsp:Transcript_64027/g.147467  ORF Transcript_64027/g.147467 Transcript_64027/m.147467 type:complete len:630 (+) Transcript_64027:214-2103(+)
MCYCDHNDHSLASAVEEERAHLSETQSLIGQLAGSTSQLRADIQDGDKELAQSQEELNAATAMRKQEAAEYEAEAAETKAAIAALAKAIPALRSGLSADSSFLQTPDFVRLSRDVLAAIPERHRAGFRTLLETAGASPAGGSGHILGVLEQMQQHMQQTLEQATQEEQRAGKAYEGLVAAKGEEMAAAKVALRDKRERVAHEQQELAESREDEVDTKQSLRADEDVLQNLRTDCKAAAEAYSTEKKARAEELASVAEAVRVLNDDDTLELMKKTLPSFVQLKEEETSQKMARILGRLPESYRGDPRLVLLQLQLRHRGRFDAVKKMINKMIASMGAEQQQEDSKRKFCVGELASAEDAEADHRSDMKLLTQKIEQEDGDEKSLAEEIQAGSQEIKDLDAAVAEATADRQAGHADFRANLADKHAAVGLLRKAKQALVQQFGKQESLLQKGRAATEEELELAFEQPATFLQMETMSDVLAAQLDDLMPAPQPPPPVVVKSNKDGKAMGIVDLLQQLIGEVQSEAAALNATEVQEQKAYELLMRDSQVSRELKSKELTDKEEARATLQQVLSELQLEEGELQASVDSVGLKLRALHEQCDELLQEHDRRQESRKEVVQALRQSLAVLSGAK